MVKILSKKPHERNLGAMRRLAPEMKKTIGKMMGVEMSKPLYEHEKNAGRIKEPAAEAREKNQYTAIVDFSRDSNIADAMHEWVHEAQDKKDIQFNPAMEDLHAEVAMTRAMEELAKTVEPWNVDWKEKVEASLEARLAPSRASEYVNGNAISLLYQEGKISQEEIDSIINVNSNEEFEQNLATLGDNHTPELLDKLTEKLTTQWTTPETAREQAYGYLAEMYAEYHPLGLPEKRQFEKDLKARLGNP